MPFPVTQQNEPLTQTVTIANGASLSSIARLPNAHELAAIIMPAAWTSAGMTFQAGASYTVQDVFAADGNEIALVLVATDYVPVAPALLNGARWIKVRSGTTGTPVNQGAERVITLVTRPAL